MNIYRVSGKRPYNYTAGADYASSRKRGREAAESYRAYLESIGYVNIVVSELSGCGWESNFVDSGDRGADRANHLSRCSRCAG